MSQPDAGTELSGTTNEIPKKLKLFGTPLSVYIITFHYLYVEFSFSIMSVIFVEFMNKMDYSALQHTLLLTSLNILVIISPLFGGIMADCWFGKFHTVLYLSVVYTSGYMLLTIAAVSPTHVVLRNVSIFGYLLVLIGCLGLNPSAVPFTGDQYQLPTEKNKLSEFFTYFYISLKIEDAISLYISSEVGVNIKCFGQEKCYSLPFGLSAISMIISGIIFFLCRRLYKFQAVESNLILKVLGCILHAINNRCKGQDERKTHLLDYANDVYDQELIDKIKTVIKCLAIYIPLSCFSITHDVITSGWSFMASRMNGDLGFATLIPFYFDFVNPALIMIFAPLFRIIIYPFFAKYNAFQTNLFRMQFGGLFLSLAFIFSGTIVLILQKEYPRLPGQNEAQLFIYNSIPCKVNIKNAEMSHILSPLSLFVHKIKEVENRRNYSYKISISSSCPVVNSSTVSYSFQLKERQVMGHHVTLDENNKLTVVSFKDDLTKNLEGFPKIRNLVSTKNGKLHDIKYELNNKVVSTTKTSKVDLVKGVKAGSYKIKINEKLVAVVNLESGGVYTMLISFINSNSPMSSLILLTKPNQLNMLWLIPQYILNALGEVLFAISGLEFTYTQAPEKLKSVMEAAWIFPSSVANILIVILEVFGELDYQLIATMLYFFFFLLFFLIVRLLKYVEL